MLVMDASHLILRKVYLVFMMVRETRWHVKPRFFYKKLQGAKAHNYLMCIGFYTDFDAQLFFFFIYLNGSMTSFYVNKIINMVFFKWLQTLTFNIIIYFIKYDNIILRLFSVSIPWTLMLMILLILNTSKGKY